MRQTLRRRLSLGTLATLLAGLAAIRILPVPPCVFHQLTGIPCLSCGATRAATAFFEGDFLAMLHHNPLIVVSAVGLVFFSLLKLSEFIFGWSLRVGVSTMVATVIRVGAVIIIAANWMFLILSQR